MTPNALVSFRDALAATPGAVAVADDRVSRTYAELAAEAGGYAAALTAAGVGPGDVVAVVAQRSPQLVAMLLGVLGSGAAYLPVEPGTPPERARRMCASAAVPVLLVQPGREEYAQRVLAGWPGDRPPVLCTADPAAPTNTADPAAPTNAADPAPGVDPGARLPAVREPAGLAYVIFTSGSTGVPKGAMVTDGGMANHLAAKRLDMDLKPSDVVGLTAPLSFDISVWQALAPLTAGGRVAVASASNLSDPAELAAWVARHGVTVLEVVPSHLAVILDALAGSPRLRADLASLRLLVATGEALPTALVRRWHECCPGVPVMNAYGPTECSDDVTHHTVTAADCAAGDWAPIGREVVNTRLYVVDPAGTPVPDGTEGELLVGGAGVGRGYLGDPVGTALAFRPDHLSGEPGGRLYRTGDRVRRAADGTLDYLGRRDRQVKIRGHRIELGEVEAQLLRVPGVAAAACVVGAGQLCAFVTLRGGTDPAGRPSTGTILDRLRTQVPGHLMPQRLTVLDRMPTTGAGKADLRTLAGWTAVPPSAGPEAGADESGAAPVDELAQAGALIAEVLRLDRVDAEQDFFAAGGDSLQAMRVLTVARAHFGIEGVALRGFLDDPTPRGLLAAVRAAGAAPQPAPAAELAAGALSSGQERLWFIEHLNRGKDPLLIHLELTLRGTLDRAALQHALDALVARHEPLRTVFSQSRGVPVATVWPQANLPIQPLADGETPAPALSIATKQPPLMAAYLARTGPDEHVLTLVLHHLVADGWSLMVLSREIAEFYQRHRAGEPAVPLPATSFSRYVSAERQWLTGPEAAECERYWRDQLAGAPPEIELPLRPRPARPDFRTGAEVRELTEAETRELCTLAQRHRATPFMAVLAAFTAVLGEVTGSGDLVVGIDSVNRSWPGSEDLVGTYVNQLPVRLTTDAAPRFGDLLALTRGQCLGAYAHDRLPFHKIVAAVNPPRRSGRFPLYQVKATHQSAWRTGVTLPGLTVLPREIPDPVMDTDLMLDMSGESDRLRLELVYLPERLPAGTAAGWADAVAAALRRGIADPDAVLDLGLRPAASGVGGR
ncbi:non-ribosomal peptide synthetase [Plantactinospora sp. KBS50]|uniref:non-ribosomal peptide synthetase n=1 Tax=Plantactinospora sp. KBS50 TaxID=2024580 RepID=UPI0018DF023F|nr:non-ribosomal peptide synthetase [Plantactinospora sp. KBS50]